MQRASLTLIGMMAAAASTAHAQTTGEGVAALAAQDFARAAAILRPIAESWPPRDRTAEFFLAAMYENGLGVPVDRLRACALYVRASGDASAPFSRVAQELLVEHQSSLGMDGFLTCLRLSSLGFDHGFQPVTFDLGAGHWISLDFEGATIAYDGREKRVDLGLGMGGARFLPVVYTELRTGPSLSVRRHFIELLFWFPREPGASWTLMWHLFEVVRDDLPMVAMAELATLPGEQPPAIFDTHEVVRLRVHESGYAEWAVLSGPNRDSQLIAADAERQEIEEQRKARTAADARVDWSKVQDVRRTPSLAYEDGDGCGRLSLYGWSGDRMEAIAIRADSDFLGLLEMPRTFDLASPPAGLDVRVHVYERPQRTLPFCSDHGEPLRDEIWNAVGGTVTVDLTPPVVRASAPSAFRATVRIDGLQVVHAAGSRASQPRPITLSAIVHR